MTRTYKGRRQAIKAQQQNTSAQIAPIVNHNDQPSSTNRKRKLKSKPGEVFLSLAPCSFLSARYMVQSKMKTATCKYLDILTILFVKPKLTASPDRQRFQVTQEEGKYA